MNVYECVYVCVCVCSKRGRGRGRGRCVWSRMLEVYCVLEKRGLETVMKNGLVSIRLGFRKLRRMKIAIANYKHMYVYDAYLITNNKCWGNINAR